MKIAAYFDGFNFYHGLTEGTKYRWCNLLQLCKQFVPEGEYIKLKLFAAHSREYLDDVGKPIRQNTYLSALKTLPEFEFIASKFSGFEKSFPLLDSPKDKPEFVKVRGYKEKGADVNLASHLLADGINNLYDLAIVATNDSDLVEPVKVARYVLKKKVYLLITCKESRVRASKELMEYANYHRIIEAKHLQASLFPDVIGRDGRPAIRKPESW